MDTYVNAFVAAVGGKVIALGVITLMDLIFGVIVSLRQGRFEWVRLADYLESDVIPIMVWLAVEILALIPSNLIPDGVKMYVPAAVYGTVFIKVMASVFGHFSALGVLSDPLGKVGVNPTGKTDSN
jgi:hypothetical protein